jgi:hypothetical protein
LVAVFEESGAAFEAGCGSGAAFWAIAFRAGAVLLANALAEALAGVVLAASAEVRPAGARAAEVFTTFMGARGVPPAVRRGSAFARLSREAGVFEGAAVARLALGTCMAVLWGSWSGLDRGSGIDCAPRIVNPEARFPSRKWRRRGVPFHFCDAVERSWRAVATSLAGVSRFSIASGDGTKERKNESCSFVL